MTAYGLDRHGNFVPVAGATPFTPTVGDVCTEPYCEAEPLTRHDPKCREHTAADVAQWERERRNAACEIDQWGLTAEQAEADVCLWEPLVNLDLMADFARANLADARRRLRKAREQVGIWEAYDAGLVERIDYAREALD